MDYVLRESAVTWLKENGFEKPDIKELERVLNQIDLKKRKENDLLILPDNTGKKVAAMVYLLDLITDSEGKPLCYDSKGFVEIPDEAKELYRNELELEELEDSISKIKKVKFGRTHSRPKRRGSVLDERY
ncbi:hypothetical protein GF318_01475 [Candidatus Micrarchaeota archaeon]|nr:hypothetical protein [Candidatus Micrarchaeota archaeon]